MNEVEKLYENCNIKPKQKGYCDWDSNCPYPHHKCNDECPYWKYEDEAKYPPFTAEKQLELIKLLGNLKDYTVEIDKFKGVYYVGCREAGSNNKHWGSHNFFEEALAELVNDLWQDLTEEERKQIKEILE